MNFLKLSTVFVFVSLFFVVFGAFLSNATSQEVFANSPNSSSRVAAETLGQVTIPKVEGEQLSQSACTVPKLNIRNLLSPTNFTPIIPNACSMSNGKPEPMPLSYLPMVLVRTYGFLASLAFYIASFMLIIYGYQWMLGGMGSYDGVAKAKSNFKRVILALIVVVLITTTISQLLSVLGYEGSIDSILNPK